MQINDNQTAPQIYYRPLRKWIEVTSEEKQNWERFIGTIRKAKQRAGACCIPYKKSYKCDGLCEECEYRCIPKDAVQHLSIDNEIEIVRNNGAKNSFLADEAMTTEISIDSMILKGVEVSAEGNTQLSLYSLTLHEPWMPTAAIPPATRAAQL